MNLKKYINFYGILHVFYFIATLIIFKTNLLYFLYIEFKGVMTKIIYNFIKNFVWLKIKIYIRKVTIQK